MATKKKVDTSNKYLYPDCPLELLNWMREIYSRYSGYEVAAAIRCIRTEIMNEDLEPVESGTTVDTNYDIAQTLGNID